MTGDQVLERILATKIIPVIRASSMGKAIAAADAVYAGGIPVVEITMTVPGALDAIRELAEKYPGEMVVGAGTVLNAEAARKCIAAGAEFIVSPGYDAGTVEAAHSLNKIILPGALTPTEVMAVLKRGAHLIKIFPCSAVGGASYIKALRGPFPGAQFVPTGGVNLQTAGDFLRAGAAALGIGGELVQAAAIEAGDYAKITGMARQYVSAVQDAMHSAVSA